MQRDVGNFTFILMMITAIYGSWLALSSLGASDDVRLCEEAMHRSGEFNARFYVPHEGRQFCERAGWRNRITQGTQNELRKLERSTTH